MEKNITTQTKVFTDVVKWLVIAAITIVCIVTVYLIAYPVYNVYKQRKEGEAQLAHAQSSKEVAVAEAKAKNGKLSPACPGRYHQGAWCCQVKRHHRRIA